MNEGAKEMKKMLAVICALTLKEYEDRLEPRQYA